MQCLAGRLHFPRPFPCARGLWPHASPWRRNECPSQGSRTIRAKVIQHGFGAESMPFLRKIFSKLSVRVCDRLKL